MTWLRVSRSGRPLLPPRLDGLPELLEPEERLESAPDRRASRSPERLPVLVVRGWLGPSLPLVLETLDRVRLLVDETSERVVPAASRCGGLDGCSICCVPAVAACGVPVGWPTAPTIGVVGVAGAAGCSGMVATVVA
jgi:hypothetical protein